MEGGEAVMRGYMDVVFCVILPNKNKTAIKLECVMDCCCLFLFFFYFFFFSLKLSEFQYVPHLSWS